MKVFIVCSKAFYARIDDIRVTLEANGHQITLPNSFDDPGMEDKMRSLSALDHAQWKSGMIKQQTQKVAANDAILVLNFDKNGQANYVGGATFLEIFKAFELGKKIYFYNPVPDGMLRDEILGMQPTLLDGNLKLIGKEVL